MLEDKIIEEENNSAEEQTGSAEESDEQTGPIIEEDSGIALMLPAIFFGAAIIGLVRLRFFMMPHGDFYWRPEVSEAPVIDLFSYIKYEAIIACTLVTLLILLFKTLRRTLRIKRAMIYYLPMALYVLFVVASYLASDYKEIALFGWDERYEGTITIIGYMVMLFYIINVVKGEKNLRQILLAIGISATLLGILGAGQTLGHDFLQTTLGQKLMSPNIQAEGGEFLHDLIEKAAAEGKTFFNFTFHKKAYQTVYNINYVAFYLTLLVPLSGMLFLHSCSGGPGTKPWKKAALAFLFALLMYNIVGASSASAYLGLGASVLVGLIFFRKQLIKLWKPLLILVIIACLVMACMVERWFDDAMLLKDMLLSKLSAAAYAGGGASELGAPASERPYIDYFLTEGKELTVSVNGNPLKFLIEAGDDRRISEISLFDSAGKEIKLGDMEEENLYYIDDERFYRYFTVRLVSLDEYDGIVLAAVDEKFYFASSGGEVLCFNRVGKLVSLEPIPAIGFKDSQTFGSGRGYVWSRTLPLLKDSPIIGSGADTFAAVFPQKDYAGRYNSHHFNQSVIVDKPHNMYLGAAVCTSLPSLLALLFIYGAYLVQAARLLRRRDFGSDFLRYASAGIFLGISGFLAAGLVNDSSVSVMPIFYTLLGTGIAANFMIEKKCTSPDVPEEDSQ